MLSTERLAAVLQLILARAALNDNFTQRQLGPIHFIKYAYLADLAYAARNNGQSFTGCGWRFYHFGPWSQQAFSHIDPVLTSFGAEQVRIPSNYEGDFVRYRIERDSAERLAEAAEKSLPFTVANAIARAVHECGSDTADLLRRVYLTPPMLSARPGEDLDLRLVVPPPPTDDREQRVAGTQSKAQRQVRALLIERTRAEMAKRFKRRTEGRSPSPPPRYDEVFAEGTAILDRMAGDALAPTAGEVTFDESIWTSDQRREPGIS